MDNRQLNTGTTFYLDKTPPSTELIQIDGDHLKVHKRENFLGSDIEICTFS